MQKKSGYCSWCLNYVQAVMISESRVTRDDYQCPQCVRKIVICRASNCDNFACWDEFEIGEEGFQASDDKNLKSGNEEKNGASIIDTISASLSGEDRPASEELLKETDTNSSRKFNQHDLYCGEHRGTVANFSTLNSSLKDPSDYGKVYEARSTNVAKYTGLGLAAVGGVAVVGPIAALSAPALGAAIGSMYGLTGAAATAKGLALLGGGALASGGFGIAGGTAVVTSVGASIGSGLGAYIGNSYLGEIQGFDIKKVRNGSYPAVITINGFLSQGEENPSDWEQVIPAEYESRAWFHVNWEAKNLLKLGGLVASNVVKGTFEGMVKVAASKASKKAAAKLSPVARVMDVMLLSTNPWHVAFVKAEKTGIVIADILRRCEGEHFILMGHSLGARVIHNILCSLATTDMQIVEEVHLLGGAVDCDEKSWMFAKRSVSGKIYNYYSDHDDVLRYLYKVGTFFSSTPVGRNPINGDPEEFVNINVSSLVSGHMKYKTSAARKFIGNDNFGKKFGDDDLEKRDVNVDCDSEAVEKGFSTTQAAKELNVNRDFLFDQLLTKGLIERPNNKYLLTKLGERSGGYYEKSKDGSDFIKWSRDTFSQFDFSSDSMNVETMANKEVKKSNPRNSGQWADKIRGRVCDEAISVFSKIWLPKLIDELATGDSPPEELLAVVLEIILWDEIRSGRIGITKQGHISGEKVSAKYYKPDFIVNQRQSEAKMILECDGFSYHDRDTEQFTKERKRNRELQRMGFFIYPISASEIFSNPWAAGLEVLDCINDKETNHKFMPIDIPEELILFAQGFEKTNGGNMRKGTDRRDSSERRNAEERRLIETKPEPDAPKCNEITFENLQIKISELPILRENLDEKIQDLRKVHARAYEPWSEKEEVWLGQQFKNSQSISDLSILFKRQPGAVSGRLRKLGLLDA